MKNEWQKIKTKWDQLAVREKQVASLGAVCVALFTIYQFLWSPLLNRLDNLRDQITTDQKTLVWMRAADKQLTKLEKNSTGNKTGLPPVALLGQLQQSVQLANLDQAMKQLKQVSNHAIQMEFQQVEFDKLIPYLSRLVKQQHIVISQLSITAENTPGIVNATLQIKVD